MELLLVSLTLLMVLISRPTAAAPVPSWIDGLPAVAQLKSLVQLATGDVKGAAQTQVNFSNQMPGVSQIKSGVHLIVGDPAGALDTQKKFLHDSLEPIVDETPLIGHAKGTIHLLAGDTERGIQIMKGATRNTAIVGGGFLGGPGGAVAAAAGSDAAMTGVESAIRGEYRPSGFVDYASRIHKKSAGDHFDQLLELGAVVGGVPAIVKS